MLQKQNTSKNICSIDSRQMPWPGYNVLLHVQTYAQDMPNTPHEYVNRSFQKYHPISRKCNLHLQANYGQITYSSYTELIHVSLDSLTAPCPQPTLAKRVLPVPGGPTNKPPQVSKRLPWCKGGSQSWNWSSLGVRTDTYLYMHIIYKTNTHTQTPKKQIS